MHSNWSRLICSPPAQDSTVVTTPPGSIQVLPIGIHRNLRHFSPVAGLGFFLVNKLESDCVLKG
jgi:hypothetical protein